MADQTVLAIRLALLPVILVIAAAAFVHAASQNEAFALGGDPSDRLGLDAHIATALVDAGFRVEMASRQAEGQEELPRLSDSLIRLARQSFANDPLAVSSLRTLALGSVVQEDEERARRLMHVVARMSKRDSISDLWLAQDYGRSGDVEAMIASLDHALRTSVRARDLAMKPMVNALASDESYKQIGGLLAQRPEWETVFWREFVRNPVAVARAADFFAASGVPLDQLEPQERRAFYVKLRREGQFDALYRLAALDSEADAGARALAAGKFATAEQGYPLGWTLQARGSFAARVHSGTGELQIDARSGAFGEAADRLIRGDQNYRLKVNMAEAMPDNAAIEVTVRCATGSARELVRVPVGPGRLAEAVEFSAQACPFAILALSFNVASGRRDALIRVASIVLEPV